MQVNPKYLLLLFLILFSTFLIGGVYYKYDLYRTRSLNEKVQVKTLNVEEECYKFRNRRADVISFSARRIGSNVTYNVLSRYFLCCNGKLKNGKIINVYKPYKARGSAIYGDISIKSEFAILILLTIATTVYTIYEIGKLIK